MIDGKKIHQNSIIGQQGINLVERVVLDMGFLWYPTGAIEAGIDGTIEIRDPITGVVFNSIVQVQSKATERQFLAETTEGFDYLCSANDLDYWLQGNAPVILIVSRPRTEEAYWVSLKDYFRDLARRKARKVHFDKIRDRFDKTCASSLTKLAMPKDAGIYLSPSLRKEQLWSNLLEVTFFADKLYVAHTEHYDPKTIWDFMRSIDEKVGSEWILKNKQIISFHNLEEYPWKKVCDSSTVECFSTDEWAYSQDSDRLRDFVWLLNQALKVKLRPIIYYDQENFCYYVRATHNLLPRNFSYQSLEKKSSRTVFQSYFSKSEPKQIAYYRHSAFEGRFKHFDDTWYLEITPTYYFTSDGYTPYKFSDNALKGIKKLERNQAILGQIVMWADYLSKPTDLFTPKYPFLELGKLKSFQLDIGIDDDAWIGQEEDDQVEKTVEAELNLPLL